MFRNKINVMKQARYTKRIWNQIEILDTSRSTFDVLEFSCSYGYTLNNNSKTTTD